jgi:putative PIN family toxin of toxin-antitoxin system
MVRVVIDTNIVVSAMLNPDTAPRQVLRLCLDRVVQPVIGSALFAEYRDVMSRDALFAHCPVDFDDRMALMNALAAVSQWTPIHYLWRPNLRDEADNHIIELAIAGQAECIVSGNKRHLAGGELLFPSLRVVTAGEFIEWRTAPWRH